MNCKHKDIAYICHEDGEILEYVYHSGDQSFWSIDPPGYELEPYTGTILPATRAYIKLLGDEEGIFICRRCGK